MKLYIFPLALTFTTLLSAPLAGQVKGTSAPMRIVVKSSAGPQLTLIQPVLAGGQVITVKDPSQRIVVEASDENGISEVLINNKKSDTNDGRLFYSNVSLRAGENIISISARNAKGNSAIKTFSMSWLSVLAPPVISISYPKQGKETKILTSQNIISVKGTALTLNGLRTVTINRQRAKVLDDGTFSLDIPLKAGDNAIVIRAADARGNTAENTFYVTRR
ncbi:MAG TPA: hypothetical protein VHO03_18860 [Ignavibacteriales bacterium]|nr:hypothetical protein [Ignavibacteriales bacterium]